MEPFNSTTVGSKIFYQCQSGFLPVGRRTLLCGEDGRWNPEPQDLCTGKRLTSYLLMLHCYAQSTLTPTADKSLSTSAAVAITAVVFLLVAFIAGTVCGALVNVCISRWNKKGRSSKPAPNTQEQQQRAVVYEEVDTLQSQKIELELKENVAYGPVKQEQKFELKDNVAYGPVKLN